MRLASLIYSSCTVAVLASLAASPVQAAKCPNVHIVLDRSGSMAGTLGSGTRWTVAKDAVNAVLTKYGQLFPIGMSIFPDLAGNCVSQLVTEPDYKKTAAIQSAMNAAGPNGGTPSGQAMHDVRALPSLHDSSRGQYVILITDGGPSCSTLDTCAGTVNEITSALKQSPVITTFVVGFGGGLASSEAMCLTQMASAGGKPAPTTDKYYKADNAADLNKALDDIITVVMGGGDVGMDGLCDDSCYSNPCPTGQVCAVGKCAPNPCDGVSCPQGTYCYTDGTSTGLCTKACTKACPSGTRCSMGNCIADPCGHACRAGTVCDAGSKTCINDPLCGNMAPTEQCKFPSSCRAGKCVDDPCRYITCPANTRCVTWEGTCDANSTSVGDPDMGSEEDDTGATVRRSGCSTIPGGAGAASFGVASLYFAALLAARRRRRS